MGGGAESILIYIAILYSDFSNCWITVVFISVIDNDAVQVQALSDGKSDMLKDFDI